MWEALSIRLNRHLWVNRLREQMPPSVIGITREQAQEWLRQDMQDGACGDYWEGDFPRYLWIRAGNQCYEARLVNQGLGQYKGYPIESDEWPEEVAVS